MQPEQRLAARLRQLGWRSRAAATLTAVAAGAAGAVAVAFALGFTSLARETSWRFALAAGGLCVALIVWRRVGDGSAHATALRLERQFPDLRNLAVTAQELRVHPDRASARMRAHVLARAADRLDTLDPVRVVPLRRPMAAALVGVAGLALTAAGLDREARRVVFETAERAAAIATGNEDRVRTIVDLEPPGYLDTGRERLVDPERIEAIEGTLLTLTIAGAAPGLGVRYGTGRLGVRREGQSAIAELRLKDSGYLAIERGAPDEAPLLIPVAVRPDAAPSVRIEAPARDLLLPDGSATLDVTTAATDDFALRSLELLYTKVSGSGEQFDFEEGTLPLAVTQGDARSWRGRARLALATLKLEPGDALVYRALARDRRPNASPASSDTFYIEIQGPGQVPLESVDLPPDQERYALSQQMIVLKIERLRAREAAMPRDALVETSANIAAEQRAVRGNFIFLMGGHVEDEEEEAAQSHEIQEGRLENSARREISDAIRHMTRAEQGLTAVNTGAALPPARAAVDALQRAFGRNRYILRTMAVRSRIDPTRRLAGNTSTGADWRRDPVDPPLDGVARESRELLSDLLALAAAARGGHPIDLRRVSSLAERALAMDPASPDSQEIARRLRTVNDAVSAARGSDEILARLTEAIAPVAALARRDALLVPPGTSAPASRLESAWAERRR